MLKRLRNLSPKKGLNSRLPSLEADGGIGCKLKDLVAARCHTELNSPCKLYSVHVARCLDS